jgi:Neuraminidase (sialidase)
MWTGGLVVLVVVATAACWNVSTAADDAGKTTDDQNAVVLHIKPDVPHRKEAVGDFVQLKDGRIMLVYRHSPGGRGGASDFAPAHLVARFSSDGGRTWTDEDVMVVPTSEGKMNVMGASLLRLQDGRIALFYLRKNSICDCRPQIRISADEGQSWGDPREVVTEPGEDGYYVLNNDRVIQLESGRIVVPLALHHRPYWLNFDMNGRLVFHLSDDGGKTWRRGKETLIGKSADGERIVTQEPGVVELKDGRVMTWCRTESGCQYKAYSDDGCETWSKLEPTNIIGPGSAATIERIPKTGELLLVWNNHENLDTSDFEKNKRTPLTVAISRDEGRTWTNVKNLEDDKLTSYCYFTIGFVGDHVLLGYTVGDRNPGVPWMVQSRVRRVSLDWLRK